MKHAPTIFVVIIIVFLGVLQTKSFFLDIEKKEKEMPKQIVTHVDFIDTLGFQLYVDSFKLAYSEKYDYTYAELFNTYVDSLQNQHRLEIADTTQILINYIHQFNDALEVKTHSIDSLTNIIDQLLEIYYEEHPQDTLKKNG